MEFGVEGYVILVMKKGKIVKTVGIEPPNCQSSLQSYKYLGILEAGMFLTEMIKLIVSKKYVRKLKKIWMSNLHCGDLVEGLNTCAVSF